MKKVRMYFFSMILTGLLFFGNVTVALAEEYLLPESATKYLDRGDISGYTQQKLNYARNEIYARHGRRFISQELMDYFSSTDWYNGTIPPEQFDELVLNDYERANVEFLLGVECENDPDGYKLDEPGYDINAFRATAGTTIEESMEYNTVDNNLLQAMLNGEIISLGFSCRIDLNADGVEEEISIEADPDDPNQDSYSAGWLGGYLIHLNDQSYTGYGENVRKELYGVSLDGRTILLIVFEEGPSEDPKCTFYQYGGLSLHNIGDIADDVSRITVNEDRTISARVRCHLIDTSYICANWTIESDNRLVMINQPYYEMHNYMYYANIDGGWDEFYAYLNQNLTVYAETNQASESIVLEPQHVTFPYTDYISWVYVLGENGEGGWLNTGEMSYEICTQIFDGLRFAG